MVIADRGGRLCPRAGARSGARVADPGADRPGLLHRGGDGVVVVGESSNAPTLLSYFVSFAQTDDAKSHPAQVRPDLYRRGRPQDQPGGPRRHPAVPLPQPAIRMRHGQML
ncbi:hypothetical protein CBM2587_B90069 [Cupriavidus taiwanensis]|uniref:Uncharacterized protein n=1 Tax=Cupriavidus taiwanensis TaxID=164546 RepID=A0A975XE73_9BURK|nr:hypothetical protein CBM2587_B90069 [Cupriavidus taiwanensis]